MLTQKLYCIYVFNRNLCKYVPVSSYIPGYPLASRRQIEASRDFDRSSGFSWIAIPCSQYELSVR